MAQSFPTYTTTCFKLPTSLCHDLESMICTFFGGQKGDNRKIHWVKWSELCKPKTQGGMGFKDLSLFNDALLAKQTWRLLHDKSSLFYRVFKAKYFPNTSVMEAKIPANSSYAWKSIMKGSNVIKRGAKWRIGSSRFVHIWGESWLPKSGYSKVLSPRVEGRGVSLVADLIDPAIEEWKVNVIDNLFYDFEAAIIINMPLCKTIQDDILIWPFNPNGVHSVKSRYRYLHEQQQHNLPGPSDNLVLTPLWKKI